MGIDILTARKILEEEEDQEQEKEEQEQKYIRILCSDDNFSVPCTLLFSSSEVFCMRFYRSSCTLKYHDHLQWTCGLSHKIGPSGPMYNCLYLKKHVLTSKTFFIPLSQIIFTPKTFFNFQINSIVP